jgi:hypothetical protein
MNVKYLLFTGLLAISLTQVAYGEFIIYERDTQNTVTVHTDPNTYGGYLPREQMAIIEYSAPDWFKTVHQWMYDWQIDVDEYNNSFDYLYERGIITRIS